MNLLRLDSFTDFTIVSYFEKLKLNKFFELTNINYKKSKLNPLLTYFSANIAIHKE